MPCTRFRRIHEHRLGSEPATGSRLPFAFPGAPVRHARDRAVDIRHVLLDLTLDFDARRIDGRVTHRLAPLRPGVTWFTLDAVEMDVASVRLNGRDAEFRHDGRRITVRLAEPLREGREVRLEAAWSCTPRRGFYFIGPDEASPDRVVHAWSQGQDEDSRHWWPVFDAPNEKASTEMIVRVPKGFAAISNGALVSRKDRGRQSVFHWKQELPHVPYLVTLCAGPFESFELKGTIPMRAWHLPGREQEARRCVKDTPRMVKLFAELTGVPYPWEKYDQVFVQEFIFGGMENTSATTLTDLVLHDRRAALDYTPEDLIAHELAHQWWGDLVTCRDWSQAWLNEGFATWFEILWKERSKGPDEGWATRNELRDEYFEEDEQYRRPIVCRTYDDPIELFDAHLYQKASLVLQMLRHELGDEMTGRVLRDYLTTHREGSVETDDLRRAIERTTGRNFEKFFEQWILSAGYPELEASASWDEDRRQVRVKVEQHQAAAGSVEAFEIPLELRFLRKDGTWAEARERVTRRCQSFAFPLDAEPLATVIDPEDVVLKSLAFDQPPAALEAVATRAPWAGPRAAACAAMGKDASPRSVAALSRVLASEDFWAVRAAAAKALGAVRTTVAEDALLQRLSDAHPKVRRAVVAALGAFRSDRAFAALQDVLENGDESYFVEAEAATSLGKTQRLDALRVLRDALSSKPPGWNEVVRCGILAGLGHVPHDQREDAIATVLPYTDERRFVRLRVAAVGALAKLGEGNPRALERLEALTDERDFRVLLATATALSKVGAARSRGPLGRLAENALDGRVKRAAREALRRIAEREPALARRLQADHDALVAETRKLRERLDRLEMQEGSGNI